MHDAGRDDCDVCDGKGHIPVESDKAYNPFPRYKRCVCLIQDKFRSHVGEDIFEAEELDESPFLELSFEDVFIRGSRKKLLPHLRYTLFERGFNFFYREVNDQILTDAWLGKSERTEVPDRDIDKGFKNLPDAVHPPDLLLIRFGVKKTPNKELPNVIFEAVKTRRDAGKPTWILNPPDYPFAPGDPADPESGHMCYSDQLDRYLDDHFQFVDIGSDVQEADVEEESSDDKSREANQDVYQDVSDLM